MEQVSEEAPLSSENRRESEQPLVPQSPAGASNHHALKIAGITTLVCLLLSAQVFTAYMVFNQRQQIQRLQADKERLQSQMSLQPRGSVDKVIPMDKMPFLDFFEGEKLSTPITPKAEPTVQRNPTGPGVEEELQDYMKDFDLPQFNQSFLANLMSLKQQTNETTWKSFESWLRNWLLFQMAQNTPTPHRVQRTLTKCQIEANAGRDDRLVGSYIPQCDDKGDYLPMQCWASTRSCWCVDKSGLRIEGSESFGHLDCSTGSDQEKPKAME